MQCVRDIPSETSKEQISELAELWQLYFGRTFCAQQCSLIRRHRQLMTSPTHCNCKYACMHTVIQARVQEGRLCSGAEQTSLLGQESTTHVFLLRRRPSKSSQFSLFTLVLLDSLFKVKSATSPKQKRKNMNTFICKHYICTAKIERCTFKQ